MNLNLNDKGFQHENNAIENTFLQQTDDIKNNLDNQTEPVIKYIFNKEFYIDRSFHECEYGFYDEEGFYHTPNGSFWDNDKEYFNHFGFDRNGGYYNEEGVYIPGEGWNSEFQCYNEDLDEPLISQNLNEYESVIEERINLNQNYSIESVNSEEFLDEHDDYNQNKFSKVNERIDYLKIKNIMQEECKDYLKNEEENREIFLGHHNLETLYNGAALSSGVKKFGKLMEASGVKDDDEEMKEEIEFEAFRASKTPSKINEQMNTIKSDKNNAKNKNKNENASVNISNEIC